MCSAKNKPTSKQRSRKGKKVQQTQADILVPSTDGEVAFVLGKLTKRENDVKRLIVGMQLEEERDEQEGHKRPPGTE